MKHIRIYVIVPSKFEYRLSSSFSPLRIEAYKRRNIELDVVRLVDTDVDSNDNESIIIDARPSSEVHLRVPEYIFKYLNEEEIGYLTTSLRFQCSHLDYTDSIFWSDLRSMFEYYIEHFAEPKYKVADVKFYYATVGEYQHIDDKSITYLKDVIECYSSSYSDSILSSDMLGISHYLLAREESDKEKKFQHILKALAYNEIVSLNQSKFSNYVNVADYALAMIDAGTLINDSHYGYAYNSAYEKAIFIMKQMLAKHYLESQNVEQPERKLCNTEYFKVQVDIVEKRLSEKTPSEFHGQIERHFNNLISNQNHG